MTPSMLSKPDHTQQPPYALSYQNNVGSEDLFADNDALVGSQATQPFVMDYEDPRVMVFAFTVSEHSLNTHIASLY